MIRDIDTVDLTDQEKEEAMRICRETTANCGNPDSTACVDMHYHHLCMRCEFLAKSSAATAIGNRRA